MLCSQKHCPWEAQVAPFQVLSILVQHPAGCSSHSTVRSLAQTCKAVREALQQSTAGSLRVFTAFLQEDHAIPAIKNFASWMAKYPDLVGELELDMPYAIKNTRAQQSVCFEAERAVRNALQHAAAAAGSPTAARPRLALKAFGCDLYREPFLLEALSAASLTRLSLGHTADYQSNYSDFNDASLDQPRVAAALARLTSMQELHLRECYWSKQRVVVIPDDVDHYAYGKLGNTCLQAIGSLSSLTKLSIACTAPAADLTLLPAQLLELQLSATCTSFDKEQYSSADMVVSLRQLSCLQQLELTVLGTPAAGWSLPAQLQSLTVRVGVDDTDDEEINLSHVEHLHIAGLQQLQQLHLTDALWQADQLQQLTRLPKLQSLSLTYTSAARACKAAPVWRQLTCLHSLLATDDMTELSWEQGHDLLLAIGAATSLVELQLHGSGGLIFDDSDICTHLTGLQRLKSLELHRLNGPNDQLDTLQLTKLTGLVHLSISDASGVDDASATAIAGSLTQLTLLEFPACYITSGAVLQEIAKLPLLEVLDISQNVETSEDGSCLKDEDMQVLLPLRKLVSLEAEETFSEEAIQQWYGHVF